MSVTSSPYCLSPDVILVRTVDKPSVLTSTLDLESFSGDGQISGTVDLVSSPVSLSFLPTSVLCSPYFNTVKDRKDVNYPLLGPGPEFYGPKVRVETHWTLSRERTQTQTKVKTVEVLKDTKLLRHQDSDISPTPGTSFLLPFIDLRLVSLVGPDPRTSDPRDRGAGQLERRNYGHPTGPRFGLRSKFLLP